MKKPFFIAKAMSFFILFQMASFSFAEEKNHPRIRATDESGCYMSDGSFQGPTIVLATGLYNLPNVDKTHVFNIIKTAIAAGCNIEEADEVGSSPLFASILYNEPELTEFLLKHGANPYLTASSPKQYLNGLNAFEWLDFLRTHQAKKDRSKIGEILDQYRKTLSH